MEESPRRMPVEISGISPIGTVVNMDKYVPGRIARRSGKLSIEIPGLVPARMPGNRREESLEQFR